MTYGVKVVQARYGVGEHTVLGWIRAGELRAVNVAKKPGSRPHWRITDEAIASFEATRSSAPQPKTRRTKRSQSVSGPYPTR